MNFDLKRFAIENSYEIIGNITSFDKFKINSKEIKNLDIFVAIRGSKFDGHEFIEEAILKGAVGIVAERRVAIPKDRFEIITKDTRDFLLNLGNYSRSQMNSKFIGITGSAGKTTTKEMVFNALSSKFYINAPKGNINTDISLPLFVVNECEGNEEIVLLEMGVQKLGDMDVLVNTFKPEMCIITNIGEAHLEFLKDKYGVLKEKFKLVDYVGKSRGVVFLNGDDPLIFEESKKYNVKKIFFGFSQNADVKGKLKRVELDEMVLEIQGREFFFPFSGKNFAYDLLAAFSISYEFGLTNDEIYNTLRNFHPLKGRGELTMISKDIFLIDETYNSNPLSLKTSLESIKNQDNNIILILGDMYELGDSAIKLHEELGEYISTVNPKILITFGELSKYTSKGAKSSGFKGEFFHFEERKDLIDFLKTLEIPQKTVIFIKGSRGVQMEEFVEIMKERFLDGHQ